MSFLRAQFKIRQMMLVVAVVAFGLVWWPMLCLLSLYASAHFGMTRHGRPGLWDGLLAGIPLTLWCLHIAVILPAVQASYGCQRFGILVTFFFYSTITMLACEIIALWRWLQNTSPIIGFAAALNWSWLYYYKVLYWGPTLGIL